MRLPLSARSWTICCTLIHIICFWAPFHSSSRYSWAGKIVNANRMAKLAEELSRSQYDQEYQELLITVDQAYWQVVSISNKKKLAENFADLLEKMEHDVNISVKEGVATESDALAIKVKANEANMMKTKATNGLVLAKMLLCKEVGIDLGTDITLADESLDAVPAPQMSPEKGLESIYQDRPETRSLDLAAAIYDKKMKIARADMMPKIALTANYMLTNPNLYNGFEKKFGGMFNVGVAINIPIFHGFEALQKTRKAKAEATLYVSKLDEAKELINLQVTQLRKQLDEALEKVEMAENNLKSAEENHPQGISRFRGRRGYHQHGPCSAYCMAPGSFRVYRCRHRAPDNECKPPES